MVGPDLDHLVALDGLLEAEAGQLVLAALEPLARPADAGDVRSGSQRTADAVTELAHRQLQGGQLPTTGGVGPQLAVVGAGQPPRPWWVGSTCPGSRASSTGPAGWSRSPTCAGDLLFSAKDTANRKTIYHVGMYLGAGRTVEAPNRRAPVRIASIWRPGLLGKTTRPAAGIRGMLSVQPGERSKAVAAVQQRLAANRRCVTVDGSTGPRPAAP